MGKKIIFENGTTSEALEFFEINKDSFGEVVKAKMEADKILIDYRLTLKNKKNEKMVFNSALTSGYQGEGCKGTLKVLKECGFDVDFGYIVNNSNFILEK